MTETAVASFDQLGLEPGLLQAIREIGFELSLIHI